MLKLLNASQTKEADKYTLKAKSISSLELMEDAANAFVRAFLAEIPNLDTLISIYCGTGNNGADGLAIARLLKNQGYEQLNIKIARFSSHESPDFTENLKHLNLTGIPIHEFNDTHSFPEENAELIIDGLIGSGLNKPLEGNFKALVDHLNQLNKNIIAIDIPTGFPSEGPLDHYACILKAKLCICFQRPKINFFFPESEKALDRFQTVNIGLDEEFIQSQATKWKLLETNDIRQILKTRKAFSHKGTYGHALIIAGNTETMGAALLCADACLHSGAGLTTACIPKDAYVAMNSYAPEVMILPREFYKSFEKYKSIAIGPGLGTDYEALDLLVQVLNTNKKALIIDADAINLLASNPKLIKNLPENCVICPHVIEFDRLFGTSDSWWERLFLAQKKAQELKIIILLKNRYTFIVCPDGNIIINPTGNPGMAVGGMGDVLCGMICAFLAQSYPTVESAILGTYLHGDAGDFLGTMNSIPPRYIIQNLPEIIRKHNIH
jgi:NAD(P)H-hydrate epimerase